MSPFLVVKSSHYLPKKSPNIFRFFSISVKPEERPSVTGFKPRHRVGDKLHMTCYINNTFPAANLTWFVAGKMVIIQLSISNFC